MNKRIKTNYPGVFYREAQRLGGSGTEKVFYIVFKKNGKLHEEKVGRQYADDMTPARAARVRVERIEGRRRSPKEERQLRQAEKEKQASRWTIEKLWEAYKENRENNKGFRVDKGRYEKYIEPAFGTKEPHEIMLLDVDRLKRRTLKGLSPQTVKHILSLLERIVSFGVKRELCKGFSFPIQKPKTNNIRTEDLTREELERLLKAIEADTHEHAGPMMKLALFTGMRRGEMFKLQWKDINVERGYILIRDPKGGQNQQIPLNDGARKIFDEVGRTESPYVFPGRGGCQRVDINKQVNKIKSAAGLPDNFRPLHGLRHTYASMLASSGKVDLYTLQKLLTHKDSRMTQRYAHLRHEALKRAANVADEAISDAIGSEKEDETSDVIELPEKKK